MLGMGSTIQPISGSRMQGLGQLASANRLQPISLQSRMPSSMQTAPTRPFGLLGGGAQQQQPQPQASLQAQQPQGAGGRPNGMFGQLQAQNQIGTRPFGLLGGGAQQQPQPSMTAQPMGGLGAAPFMPIGLTGRGGSYNNYNGRYQGPHDDRHTRDGPYYPGQEEEHREERRLVPTLS
jgi:hypothetical protein